MGARKRARAVCGEEGWPAGAGGRGGAPVPQCRCRELLGLDSLRRQAAGLCGVVPCDCGVVEILLRVAGAPAVRKHTHHTTPPVRSEQSAAAARRRVRCADL